MRHVPKKLTDCPENLRESIDWLIQVRHGNGKPDEGLTKLSQALKKLIEEAIEKALESLNKQYPLAGTPSNVASTGVSAPSTVQSTGSTKSLSEKIKNEIESVTKLQKSLNVKQTSQYNPLTDEDSKRLSDCQSKLSALKTVDKLCDFANELTKTGDNNILNNLCTGLETFLGFNKESKGYDGTGIVYSDLDRLCDAVMGFLSGVLKDVSEKQPYSVGKREINELVTELGKRLSTGRKGFKVIAQVAGKC